MIRKKSMKKCVFMAAFSLALVCPIQMGSAQEMQTWLNAINSNKMEDYSGEAKPENTENGKAEAEVSKEEAPAGSAEASTVDKTVENVENAENTEKTEKTETLSEEDYIIVDGQMVLLSERDPAAASTQIVEGGSDPVLTTLDSEYGETETEMPYIFVSTELNQNAKYGNGKGISSSYKIWDGDVTTSWQASGATGHYIEYLWDELTEIGSIKFCIGNWNNAEDYRMNEYFYWKNYRPKKILVEVFGEQNAQWEIEFQDIGRRAQLLSFPEPIKVDMIRFTILDAYYTYAEFNDIAIAEIVTYQKGM